MKIPNFLFTIFSSKSNGTKPAKSNNTAGDGAQPNDSNTGDNKIKNNCFFKILFFWQNYQICTMDLLIINQIPLFINFSSELIISAFFLKKIALCFSAEPLINIDFPFILSIH